MKKYLTPVFASLLALGTYGQAPAMRIENNTVLEENQQSAKKSGDFYVYSAREDLESALLRASEAWKWRQASIVKSNFLTDNHIETNLIEYVAIASLRHNAALQEKLAGGLVLGAMDSLKRAQRIYLDHGVKSRLEPPIVNEYLDSRNCFLRAEEDIAVAITNYQLGKNNLGEASLREALSVDARQKAEEYRQRILRK